MFFKTDQVCPNCNAEIWVYPASIKMSKINARTLPGWTRCECYHRFNEISAVEFDILVPGWRDRLVPDEGEDEGTFDEALDDVKKLVDELSNSVI